MSSDDDTDSTEESDGEYDSGHYSDVFVCMEDVVDALDGIDLDGDVDMEMDGDDEQEEDQEEEDEEEEDEEEEDEEEEDEEKEEDEYEDKDEDEDDGKESRTICQGEMVNTSPDDADTMVYNQGTMLPEQGQEMRENTPWLEPLAPALRPQTPEPCPPPQTPVTHPISGLKFLVPVTPRITSPSGANSGRSRGSRKHLGCRCGYPATWWIARCLQSPQCPSPQCPSPQWSSPQCPSPWGAPGCLGMPGVNQSSGYRGGEHSGYGRVIVLWVSFAVIHSSQALIKTQVEVFCLLRVFCIPARLG